MCGWWSVWVKIHTSTVDGWRGGTGWTEKNIVRRPTVECGGWTHGFAQGPTLKSRTLTVVRELMSFAVQAKQWW
jgi:hypothetical protein